jgi:SsrA-binding protein
MTVQVRFVARNRRARFDYFIKDEIEAGIVLVGTEVKALREGKANLQDAWAGELEGNLVLFNAYISEYKMEKRFNHETRRPRLLLVHRQQRNKLLGAVRREGMTLVPIAIYFNTCGLAKIELGLGKGKRIADKRERQKERDWQREKLRLMRAKC